MNRHGLPYGAGRTSSPRLYGRSVELLVFLLAKCSQYEQKHSTEEVDNFIAKLRVYSISDQDNGAFYLKISSPKVNCVTAGAWLRHRHNSIFWILSVHGMNLYVHAAFSICLPCHGFFRYTIAAWVGISGEGFYPFDAV